MYHYALSLGAGINSTALLHLLIDEKRPLDEVVFADTGAEKPETYTYIDHWIKPYLIERGIPYTRVAAKETLIERCMRSRAIPDRQYRWSTRDYKIRPINRHLKPKAPVVVYLGIGIDEAHRVKPSPDKWQIRDYPLIEHNLSRQDCIKLIEIHNWPIPVKSGCWFCPFTNLTDWRWLLENHPELYSRAIAIEKNGSKYPQFTLKDGYTLEVLQHRFEKEALAEKEQSHLDQYQEECEGYCFT
jgi:3'-phosphoadenosine 5'-phosphosulfate sulfotransferase (PAPS reductase)/FAD synthetase